MFGNDTDLTSLWYKGNRFFEAKCLPHEVLPRTGDIEDSEILPVASPSSSGSAIR